MQKPFTAVALIGKYFGKSMDARMRDYVQALTSLLVRRGIRVSIESITAEKLGIDDILRVGMESIGKTADLAIVLGGDGTMLTAARALLDDDVPLIGINRGRFGFLTDISTDGMPDAVGHILDGEYTTEQRILLGASIERDGRVLSEGRALNDIVVSKGDQARLIELELTINGQYVHRQRSDGLIVSTPTGTTAYALSAGGPLLHPTLEAIALVPICPHTLSNRPFAINSASTVEIAVKHADDARVHFDGQLHAELGEGDKVVVKRLDKTIRLLHPLGHSHYDILREKLHWG